MAKGIFDPYGNNEGHVQGNTTEPTQPRVEKLNFPTAGDAVQEKEEVTVTPVSQEEKNIQTAMDAVNSSSVGSGDDSMVSKEEEEILEITEEEETLAEEMLFKGYAEKKVVIPMFRNKGTHITVCTATPQDVSIVNGVVYDLIRNNEDKDGNMTIPEIEIATTRNAYSVALSFVGINDTDICDDIVTAKLQTLKMAIRKMGELLSTGDLNKGEGLKADIERNLRIRVERFKQFPIPVIDFITDEKFKFEDRMFQLMSREAILPKS